MSIRRTSRSPFYTYDIRIKGVRYRGTTKLRDKEAARVFEENLQLELRMMHTDHPLHNMKLRELLNGFASYVRKDLHLAPKSIESYLRGVALLQKSKLSDKLVGSLRTSTIRCEPIGSTVATRNAALRTLRRALSLACEWGVISAVPRIHLLRDKLRTRLFTPLEAARLLEAAEQPLKDIFLLLLNTGMRPKEVCFLRWSQVDLERKVLRIENGKTLAANRYIALTDEAQSLLLSRNEKSTSCWVFPSKRNSEGHVKSVSHAFIDARKRAGLSSDLVLYSVRHTYATILTTATGDAHLVAAQMGHSSIAHTGRYIHPNIMRVADVMNGIPLITKAPK